MTSKELKDRTKRFAVNPSSFAGSFHQPLMADASAGS
jgi:hypothetical protein